MTAHSESKGPRVKRALVVLSLVVIAACNHPPRLDNDVANRHREVVGPGTPLDKTHELVGVLGEDTDDLSSLAKKAKAGDTIDVKLGPGVYTLEKPVVVKGAKLVIRGPGADKTRIKLNTDDWRALSVEGSPDFELRGVTVAGYTGGGIDARNCARVVVNECDFAGSRYGLELADCSLAVVDSCVFVGCEKAIAFDRTKLVLRGTAIVECWGSLIGTGQVEALGDVLAGNVDGANFVARSGTRFRSCLFGRLETFQTVGSPDVRSSLLFDDLYERFKLAMDADDNQVIRDLNDFPDGVTIPRNCDMGAIHYALERSRSRGMSNLNERIRAVLETEARKYATAATKAMEKKDTASARWLQQLALDYLQAVGGGEDALRAQVQNLIP
jgi:hypothetical protein